jgi:hypothetical protein
MAQKKELVQFTVQNNTDCDINVPLLQRNIYSINATTKYSWNIQTIDLSCGSASIIVNGATYPLSYTANSLASFLSALNNLDFGFFCTETISSVNYLYTQDDTNVYGNVNDCATGTTTSTTTTSTTAVPTTSTTTTSTTLPGTSTTTTTTTGVPTTSTTTTSTTLPSTSTTTTTTTDVPTTSTTTTSTTLPVTSTTTTTTTEAPTTSTTTTTTTEAPTTSTTTTTTTEAPTTSTTTTTTTEAPTTSTTTTTTTEAPTTSTTTSTTTQPPTTSTTTTTTTVAFQTYVIDNGASGDSATACSGSTTTSTVYTNPENNIPIVGMFLYTDTSLTTAFVGSTGWRKLVKDAVNYAAEVNSSGELTNYVTC